MQKIFCFLLLPLLTAQAAIGQDTIRSVNFQPLQEIVVSAFEQNKQLKEVSAAVSIITKSQLERFSNTSLVPVINTAPGVRMEERSPGSYRLNIRGSTLRSPFGVRNVKIYWNNIPFTDPGGNTYLNQLSFSNIQSIEIIKGPAGSIYGAGTGGALLLKSMDESWQPGVSIGYVGGSYATNSLAAQAQTGSTDARNNFTYSHQTSDGYRYHTQMRRDIVTWETQLKVSSQQQISTQFLYGDLYYQTPGGLTLKEFTANPRAYRPAVGALPSAEQSQAAIYQKMVLAGITDQYHFNDAWQNTTTVYGAFVQFTNPTFRTYEKRSEPHFGGRTVFSYNKKWGNTLLQWVIGAEAQRGFFNTKDFKNKAGRPDSLQTDDDINSWIYAVFSQVDLVFPGNWELTAGASFNQLHLSDQRLSDPGLSLQERTYSNELAPRLAVSKKISPQAWLYMSVAKGFSPPAVAEVLPPSRTINTGLNAERGINYEVGFKSSWLGNRLYLEVNAFYFRLQDAIVQRQDSSAANYYINAGNTKQQGLESQFSYQLLSRPKGSLQLARIWMAHTWDNFHYDNFKQINSDFSGNRMPSVARHTVTAGLDVESLKGFYANITYYYSDPIPLNDANTDFASSYNLLGGRIGYKKNLGRWRMDVFAGGDNLFNMTFSLGNDINAAGGRYYNAAPGVNYFGGLLLKYSPKKNF